MSSIVIAGDTSGTVTLSAPATAGTTTLTLPATSGTVLTTASGQTLDSPTIATPTITGQAIIPTINLTGGQITFPATDIPSANANTLDDYEEGTWTPTLTPGAGSITSYTSNGTYVKIGRLVTLNLNYTVTNNGTGSSFANIENFPFAVGARGASAVGRIGGTTGNTCTLDIAAGASGGSLWTYNNAYPWATSASSTMTITYQTA